MKSKTKARYKRPVAAEPAPLAPVVSGAGSPAAKKTTPAPVKKKPPIAAFTGDIIDE